MTQTLAAADAVLKDVYEGPVIEQLNQKMYMLDQIERETKFTITAQGRRAILSAHYGRNRGRKSGPDGATLPNAGEQKYEDIQVPINFFYQGIEVTDAAVEMTKSSEGSFVNLLHSEVDGATKDMKKDVNRQIWGPGNGKLASIRASSTASTLNIDSLQYIHIGDPVDVLVQSTGATTNGIVGTTVTALNETGPTATIAGTLAGACDTTYGVYLSGSYGQEMKSLQEIVATGRSLFGINSATAGMEWWNSQVIDVGSSASSTALAGENAFERIVDKVGATGQGETESFVTTRGIRRGLADSFQSTKRFTNREAVKIHGGFSAILVSAGGGELPVLIDDDCPKQNVFAIDKAALRWYQTNTPGFLADPKNGQIMHLKTTGSSGQRVATWQGWLRWYASLATVAPNRLGRLRFCTDEVAGITQ